MEVVSAQPLCASSVLWQSGSSRVLTLVCKATFTLAPGESPLAESQEPVNEDDAYWDDDPAKSLYAPSDLVPFKARADVILVGNAFAPRGELARAVVVRMIVGEIDKAIEVVVDRAWRQDGALHEGPRFARMPLRYERAAGGPDTANPIGVRADARPNSFGMVPLPNLQPLGLTIAARSDLIAPVGYGPIAPSWPLRREKLGRLAGAGLPGRWSSAPLPPDIEPAYFNSAPRDQQTEELRVNERIILENLHPDHPRLVTNLPGVRPRAFLDLGGRAPQEIGLRCETLWIDSSRSICTLTWRGHLENPPAEGRVRIALERPGKPLVWPEVEQPSRAQSASERKPPEESSEPAPWIRAQTTTLIGGERHAPGTATSGLPFGRAPAPPASSGGAPFAPAVMFAPQPEGPARGADAPLAQPAPATPFNAQSTSATPFNAQSTSATPFNAQSTAATPFTAQSTSATPFTAQSTSATPFAPPPAPSTPFAPQPPPVTPFNAQHASSTPFVQPPQPAAPPSVQPPSSAPFAPQQPPSTPFSLPSSPASGGADGPWAGSASSPQAPPIVGPEFRALSAEPGRVPADVAGPPSSAPWATVDPRAGAAAPMTVGQAAALTASLAEPAAPLSAAVTTAPTPAAARQVWSGRAVQLVWFDPESLPRIHRKEEFQPILRELEERRPDTELDDPTLARDPVAVEDRRDVFEVLARGASLDEPRLSQALEGAVRDDGKFIPPLAIVDGEVRFLFDELEALRVTLTIAAVFSSGDEPLKAAIAEAREFLRTPDLRSPPSVTEGYTARVQEALKRAKRGLAPGYLEEQAERVLVEARHYQRRTVYGAVHLRAQIQIGNAPRLWPVYVPEAAASKLPMFARFSARVLAEIGFQESQYEAHPTALRALAIARVSALPGKGERDS